MSEPQGLDDFLKSKPLPPSEATSSPVVLRGTSEPSGLDEFLGPESSHPELKTPVERAKADAEAVARGLTLGASDVALTKLGITNPEKMRMRREANPTETNIMQMLGGAGTIAATGGLAEPVEAALGGGKLATAAGYGLEGAGFGAGNVVSDYALGDPNLNAQKIATEVGMSALLGVGAGLAGRGIKSVLGKYGYLKNTAADAITEAAEESNSKSEVSSLLGERGRLKENTPEIVAAAQELGAPLSEGMVSADPWVQKAEDALINGAPTYHGIKKARLYEEGYDAVKKNIEQIAGEAEAQGGLSKAQLGGAIEQSLTSKIAEENQPISQLYGQIKEQTQNIPIGKKSLSRIASNIMDLDQVRLDPDGPAGRLARRMSKNIDNISTVDEVKSLRKILNDSIDKTASNNERFVLSEISDRLKALEENTIERYAKNITEAHAERLSKLTPEQAAQEQMIWGDKIGGINSLLEQKKQADTLYKPFIEKIQTLAKMLGKKSVSGAQGAINFITHDLTPEQIASRAFQKGNSEMATFFAKSFPNEWELVKQYQKGALRDAAIVERTGQLNSRSFIKQVDKLEPEIQKLIFNSDELKKIKAAKTYLQSMPESFNPSGTSHTSAMRAFFEHPTGAAIANVRDFGIYQFIKRMGKLPPHMRGDPTVVGMELADKFNKFNATRNLADRVSERITEGAKSIFGSGAIRGAVLEGLGLEAHSYEDRIKRIQALLGNPEAMGTHLSNSVYGINDSMPRVSQSMQNAMMASVLFLDSKIPKPPPQFMLSPKWAPNQLQIQKFNKYYNAVADPLSILKEVKTGKMTSESLEAVSQTHPDLFNEMRTQVLMHMDQEKAKSLPYSVKQCLSQFLGQPLDSSMLPPVIIANQMTFSGPPSPNGPSPKQQRSTQAGLAKLNVADRAQTDTQSLEEETT